MRTNDYRNWITCLVLKMRALPFFERTVTVQQSTNCNKPKDSNLSTTAGGTSNLALQI